MSMIFNYLQSCFKEFLILGILAFLGLSVGYLLVKKFLWKGKKVCSFARVIFGAMFLAYLLVVCGLTLLNRTNGMYTGRQVVPLFYSYKSAWYSPLSNEWKNIVANILLFVPFGCLLPMSIRWFQSFVKTYLAGFFVTVGIETMQYAKDCGVSEMDDILNNLLGTMIGYGIFVAGNAVFQWGKRKLRASEETRERGEKGSWLSVILLQIPLLVTVFVGVSLYFIYAHQELGNLSCGWDSGYSMEEGQVHSQVTFDTKQENLPVYQIKRYSKEEARDIAEKTFSYFGASIEESDVKTYEDSVIYSDGQEHQVWINYMEGSVSYVDFSDRESGKSNVEEAQLRQKLQALGQYIPKAATFEKVYGDSENQQYRFIADMCKEGDYIYDGELTVVCCGKQGKICRVSNHIVACKPYKEYSARSQQEAYARIVEGKFPYPVYLWKEKEKFEVEKPYIEYLIDSKGFYQPVYVFPVESKQTASIYIPAIP